MNNVAIFGGTGFIGKHLCEQLGDRACPILREHRVAFSNDIVYMISTNHNYHVHTNVHIDVHTNLVVLMEVLEALQPEQTFNFISSWFVYGDVYLPADESSSCNPKGFYSITKRAAEQLVISYCETKGIKYRILRLCNVYGPGDHPTPQKNALQYLIEEMRLGHSIKLYNGGKFCRDYMHVKDICRAIELCIDKAQLNAITNIGSGQKTLFCDIIGMAARQMKIRKKPKSCEPSDFHKQVQVKDFYMSNHRLLSLGFKPQISLERGIRELIK